MTTTAPLDWRSDRPADTGLVAVATGHYARYAMRSTPDTISVKLTVSRLANPRDSHSYDFLDEAAARCGAQLMEEWLDDRSCAAPDAATATRT
jgi:hypothetical protein